MLLSLPYPIYLLLILLFFQDSRDGLIEVFAYLFQWNTHLLIEACRDENICYIVDDSFIWCMNRYGSFIAAIKCHDRCISLYRQCCRNKCKNVSLFPFVFFNLLSPCNVRRQASFSHDDFLKFLRIGILF